MIKLPTNGRKLNINTITLEDVITERNVVLRFLDWLHQHTCEENLTFWLETQNFKYLKNSDEVLAEAEKIYKKYFNTPSSTLNIDDPIAIKALEERKKLSDRTLFMGVQNVIWGLLKLESFPKFRAEIGKNMVDKLPKNLMKQLTKMDHETIQLYDKFIELNNKFPQTSHIFKPNILPFDDNEEHRHQNLPPIDELWKDRDMMLAFRQYLYEKCTYENLSFYLYYEVFQITPEDKMEEVSHEIYDTYFSSTAPTPLNIDYMCAKKLAEDVKKPHNKMYDVIGDRIYRVLTDEWFPQFVMSSFYKSLNEETITLNRERSRTMDNYDIYTNYIKTQKSNGEDNEEKEGKKEQEENKERNKEEGEKIPSKKDKKKKEEEK